MSEREVRYTLNDAIRLGKLKNSSGEQEFSARIGERTHHITKHAFWKTIEDMPTGMMYTNNFEFSNDRLISYCLVYLDSYGSSNTDNNY